MFIFMAKLFGAEITLIDQEIVALTSALREIRAEEQILNNEERMLEFLEKHASQIRRELTKMEKDYKIITDKIHLKEDVSKIVMKLTEDYNKYWEFASKFEIAFVKYVEMFNKSISSDKLLQLEEVFRQEVNAINKRERELSMNLFGKDANITGGANKEKLIELFKKKHKLK